MKDLPVSELPDADAGRQPFHLAELLVDPERCLIQSSSGEVAVQPKVMDVLLYLSAHHGQMVRKEALFEHIWPRGFVVDGVLKRCIFQLRKALGDDARAPRFIETTPKRGYRLLVAPEAIATAPHDDEVRPSVAATQVSPYRGLLRYELSDAEYFVGRTSAIARSLAALDAQFESGRGFLLLLGPSGSGKSSLARAGVLPALLQRKNTVHGIFQFSEHGTDPFEALAATLLLPSALGGNAAFNLSTQQLAQQLLDAPGETVESIVVALKRGGDEAPGRLVLVFDQFEEMLISANISDDQRDAFFAVLYALARSGSVWVIVTLRSDFYVLFARYPLLCQLRSPGGQIDVDFPGPSQITDIVRAPARMAGLQFEALADGRTLDDRIIDDAANQADCLPVLSFLLEELYKRRSDDNILLSASYESMGGLQGCLTRRAEEVYQQQSPATREALGRVFNRLIRADADNAGRVVAFAAQVDDFNADPPARALVDAFVEARLFTLRVRDDTSGGMVKFAHEALFRFWPRARDWVQSNYADLRFRRWLEQLAQRWDGEARSPDFLLPSGKPLVEAVRLMHGEIPLNGSTQQYIEYSEKRSLRSDRLRRMTGAGLAFLAVVAVILAGVAGWQNHLAQVAQRQTQAAAAAAEQTSEFLVSVFDVANPNNTVATPTARELLDQSVHRIAGTLRDAPATRARVLQAMGKAYRGLGVLQQSRELLEEALLAQRSARDVKPEDTVLILVALANVQIELGLLDQAQMSLDAARAEHIAETHTVAGAQILNEQGRLFFAQGNHAQALAAFEQRLALLTSLPADDPLERASTLNNIAAAYWSLGSLNAAEKYYGEAIALRRAAAGELDVELADYLSNFGVLLQSQGNLDGAQAHFEEALIMRRTMLGDKNPDNARTLSSLGMLLMQREQFPEAADILQDAATVASASLGDQHSLTALARVQWAEALLMNLSPAAALEQARLGHSSNLHVHGDDHLNSAYSDAVVGLALLCMGNSAGQFRLNSALDNFHSRLPGTSTRPTQFEVRVSRVAALCTTALLEKESNNSRL